MGDPMGGAIDIVCNLYTPREVRLGQTGIDATFKKQIRMSAKMRKGITISDYLKRMDRAGIEHSLLIAVRAGDLNVRKGVEGNGYAVSHSEVDHA